MSDRRAFPIGEVLRSVTTGEEYVVCEVASKSGSRRPRVTLRKRNAVRPFQQIHQDNTR